jgi:hypothetical protein
MKSLKRFSILSTIHQASRVYSMNYKSHVIWCALGADMNLHEARMDARAWRATAQALAASLFFSLTFVLNRQLIIGGRKSSWIWGVVFRYIFTALVLGSIVLFRHQFKPLFSEIRHNWGAWLVWSGVGFGVFGGSITWAAASGPGWLVASGFQSTILIGPLLAPFIYNDHRKHISLVSFAMGALILIGITLIEISQSKQMSFSFKPFLGVIIAAICYPLGNRKLLLHLEKHAPSINTLQRVYGMTIMSLVVLVPLGSYALFTVGLPSTKELLLAGGVAVSSGVIATLMFFAATRDVQRNPVALAAVEAMQSGEILFSIVIGTLFLGAPSPHGLGLIGVLLAIVGVIVFHLFGSRSTASRNLNDEPA